MRYPTKTCAYAHVLYWTSFRKRFWEALFLQIRSPDALGSHEVYARAFTQFHSFFSIFYTWLYSTYACTHTHKTYTSTCQHLSYSFHTHQLSLYIYKMISWELYISKLKGAANMQFRFYLMKYVRRGVASIPTCDPFQVRRRSCISQTCILSHSSATVLTSSFYDHAPAHSCNMKRNLNSPCASMTISVYIYIVKSNHSIRDDQSAKQSS